MTTSRYKLLITLVLAMVAVTAVWSSAHARTTPGVFPGAWSVLRSSHPGATPTSGEPDAGNTKAPPQHSLEQTPGGSSYGKSPVEWFRWAGRIWAMQFLKAKI